MVRHLIWTTFDIRMSALERASELGSNDLKTGTELMAMLEEVKSVWLNEPSEEFEGQTPINIIDNECRRIPEAMGGRSMVIDENCPTCKMMGDEAEAGLGIYFWHLDGCNMEDEFAFSTFLTIEEWEAERREMEEHRQGTRPPLEEREQRLIAERESVTVTRYRQVVDTYIEPWGSGNGDSRLVVDPCNLLDQFSVPLCPVPLA